MRLLASFTALAALLAATHAGHAQFAYNYPWCAVYTTQSGLGVTNCAYRSYGQCMQTMSGIGGYCIRSAYYGHGRWSWAHRY